MIFGTPEALWFLILIPFFVVLHYRSFSDMGRIQRALSLSIRLVLLVALIMALADSRLSKRSDELSVIYLVDGSHSVGAGGTSGILDFIRESYGYSDDDRDSAGIIAFGGDASVESRLGEEIGELVSIESELSPEFTDIGSAIDLALASLPGDTGARLVLMSDGNQNLGDAYNPARIAANRGVEIDVVPYGESVEGEVSAEGLMIPRRVEVDEAFDVRVILDAETETDAVLDIYENEVPIASIDVHLDEGKNVFAIPRSHSSGGFNSYRVQVSADSDILGSNNRATDYTIVEGQPRVCYISGDPNEEQYVVDALLDEGIQATFTDLSGLPTSLLGMVQYDAILFSDVGAELLMPETMRAYEAYVHDLGGGFGMVGGVNSFGPGGYYQTEIEELLPVNFDLTKKEILPSMALALVVDSSGSMAGTGVGSKIDIAKEACRLAVELLDASDQITVITFDSAGQTVVPLTNLANKDEVIRRIGTIVAGGGTSVYAGMEPAYIELRDADAAIRHMIILSDGWTAGGDFDTLLDLMNDASITVSTIGVGMGADEYFMRYLSENGGGNYYYTDDIRTVPRIFTKETFQFSNRALVEEPFQARLVTTSPVVEGINWADSPSLLGYVTTTIKPLATEALATHKADPLLAHWQYGLGRSLAFTSDAKAHWAASWLNWSGFSQMWTQGIRWLVGTTSSGDLTPSMYFRGGRAYLAIDAIDSSGELITDAVIGARVSIPSADIDVADLDLYQAAPGRYEASIDATEIGSYMVNFYREDENGDVIDQVMSGFSVSYPPEYETSGPDMYTLGRLADITGGVINPSADQIFRHTNQPIAKYIDLWYYLLMIVIILLPFDIAIRRLALTGESLSYVKERLASGASSILGRYRRTPEDTAHLEQLRKIKEQYRLTSTRERSIAGDEDVEKRLSDFLSKKKPDAATRSKPEISHTLSAETEKKEKVDDGSLGRLLKAKKRVWDDKEREE